MSLPFAFELKSFILIRQSLRDGRKSLNIEIELETISSFRHSNLVYAKGVAI